MSVADTAILNAEGPWSERNRSSDIKNGVRLHPHLFRYRMAHRFLADNGNDVGSKAQILGHENLNMTKRYVQRTEGQLAAATERVTY
jgi:site-specific recombinase XerD